MASNGKPQSVTNVFSRQPKGGVAAALNASVRQDKGRIASAPVGTPQPAPQTNPVRPHPLTNGATRSQNRPDPNRKTVHLTLHVDPIVKRELQRLAAQEGLTVSKTGAAEGRMEQGIPLMTAQEIKELRDEDVIVYHRQLPPIRATRMDWRRFPVLRERQAIPPPELSALPELADRLPTPTPHSNGQLTGYINPDMAG
jgi:hypothetical protein